MNGNPPIPPAHSLTENKNLTNDEVNDLMPQICLLENKIAYIKSRIYAERDRKIVKVEIKRLKLEVEILSLIEI